MGMKNLEESRPLHEEASSRETRIRSIHEVEELKRAQEMRIDDFSMQKLRESHATIQELTSQIQEFAGKSDLYERLQRISRCRIDLQWTNYPTFPVDRQSCQALVPCRAATKADLIRGICSGAQGNVCWQSTCSNRFVIDTLSRNASLLESEVLRSETPSETAQGDLFAKSEKQFRGTIPLPSFARKPSTMNSFFPAEGAYPQNSMFGQQRLHNLGASF